MTMQIKGLQIAGLPAIVVRNMLRRVHSVLDQGFVRQRCNVSDRLAKQILQRLVSEGYIEFFSPDRVLVYPVTAGKDERRYRSINYYKLTKKATS